MDRLIYVAMSAANHTLTQQATVAQNLANISTNGYRAQTNVFRAVPVVGDGTPTRSFVIDSTPGADFTPGAIQTTGRDLDVAIQGKGWIAVQAADGSEAYTRDGGLQTNQNGMLITHSGQPVLGDGGPISIPADTRVTVAGDGTVSTVPNTTLLTSSSVVGRIKLVNPPEASLTRGADGLFRVSGGAPATADASVQLVSGAVESSNVNPVDGMINMIALARQFDMQMKMLQSAESNAQQATQLLAMPA